MKSLTLIIDTAHPAARLLLLEGERVFGKREWENTPKVGTDLLVYIDEVLQEAGKERQDIERVAVHAGPGSYGVLRSGITTATILAQALGAELVETQGETVEEMVESARGAQAVAGIAVRYKN